MATEFLPICDNLFNVISLAAYFCDCVFDIVLGYALLERGRYQLFAGVVFVIVGSLIVSQVKTLKHFFLQFPKTIFSRTTLPNFYNFRSCHYDGISSDEKSQNIHFHRQRVSSSRHRK